MASETLDASYPEEEDDCHENIPPEPLEICSKALTPASTNKVKSQLPGLPSALTPFIKFMNIADKCPPPEPLKCASNSLQDVPRFTFGNGGTHTGSYWLYDETLPEITLLDDTSVLCSPCGVHQCPPSNTSLPIVAAVTNNNENSPQTPLELSKLEGKPTENILFSEPTNTTCNINSPGNMPAQNAQLPTSDMKCNTTKTPPSPSTADAANCSSTLLQPSNLTVSPVLSKTTPMSPPQSTTLDVPQSDVPDPEMKSDATDQTSSISSETSLIKSPISSAVKETNSSDVQHTSAEGQPLQNSSGSAAVETTITIQNDTFECRQPNAQNDTIIKSESSSSDSHRRTMDKQPSPQICNLTTSLREAASEAELPEQSGGNGTQPAVNPDVSKAENYEGTFEVPPSAGSSAAGRYETKDDSKSIEAVADCSTNSIDHQNLSAQIVKTNTFNLDDTLDLGKESLVTSTPIVYCKLSGNSQREEGRNPVAQKKLLGEDPVKSTAQAASKVPQNLVCDRKTFLKQPCLPPPRCASQLLKSKAASALPGRFQPVTRQQTKASGNAAAPDSLKGTTGTSSTYNLRATATGLKLPVSGLRKPQQSGIPSASQRIAPGPKIPSAKGNRPAPEQPCGPAAVPSSNATSRARVLKLPTSSNRAVTAKVQTHVVHTAMNPVAATSQSKKHPLPRKETVPSKKLKMGCANCALLEEQNKTMAEEINRLKEELLKYQQEN